MLNIWYFIFIERLSRVEHLEINDAKTYGIGVLTRKLGSNGRKMCNNYNVTTEICPSLIFRFLGQLLSSIHP